MTTENPYKEAMRYIDNARQILKRSKKDGKFYDDIESIKNACKSAYPGMLKGLDFLFNIRGVPKKRGRKSIEYYKEVLTELNPKLLNDFNTSFHMLRLHGYYGKLTSIKAINAGIDSAAYVIAALKPYSKNGTKSKHK